MPASSARPTSASTLCWSMPPITSQICPRPPNVIAPRHSSETNTPVSASSRYFMVALFVLRAEHAGALVKIGFLRVELPKRDRVVLDDLQLGARAAGEHLALDDAGRRMK